MAASEREPVELLGQRIRDLMVSGAIPQKIEFVEFKPDWEGMFHGNAAVRFGCSNLSNDSVIEALEWLDDQSLVVFDRNPDEGRSSTGAQGQPYPERFECTVELR